jgi:hypothetical protein
MLPAAQKVCSKPRAIFLTQIRQPTKTLHQQSTRQEPQAGKRPP